MNDDHVKDQLCARIEELEAEKMEQNEQLDIAQQERDALAAHVERLRDAGAELVDLMDGVREGDYKPDSFTNQPMNEALAETPATSLARLKPQWQAEALDEASNEFEVHERARMVLRWKAQKIRQQAEENTQ